MNAVLVTEKEWIVIIDSMIGRLSKEVCIIDAKFMHASKAYDRPITSRDFAERWVVPHSTAVRYLKQAGIR